MKVSLIAAVYKDIEALQCIVSALEQQTYSNFELIVAEDAETEEMARYVNSVSSIDILHTSQQDCGIRKSRSINNAILASSGEYLIFIDGDCIPYTSFIEGHLSLAEKGTILSGRRVNLGNKISTRIRRGNMSSTSLEKHIILYTPYLLLDGATHIEQGLRTHTESFLYRNVISKRKRNTSLLGCNFSCHKDDMFIINGFDESYEGTAVADDTDLEWRMKSAGLAIKSCKNVANVFHLYHTSEHRDVDSSQALELMTRRKEKNEYYCKNGLDTHAFLSVNPY